MPKILWKKYGLQLLIAAALVPEAQAAGLDVGPPLGPLAFGPDGRIAAWADIR